MKTISLFLSLLKTSIKASMSKRGAFLIESGLMIGNNLLFLAMWWLFFRQFNDIAGWHFRDMVVLMAVGTGGYGLMNICFGGIKQLSNVILSGNLDPYMTQPRNLLLSIAGSRSIVKGWGNLMTVVILIFISEIKDPLTVLLILLSIVSACAVYTAFNIIAHSLVFWTRCGEGLSKKYCDALFLFAVYPTNIYSGLLQVVMFTLIPAGIIGYLPVELVRNFTWLNFMLLIGSACAFFSLSFFVFYSGLKKYESGNMFVGIG